ncbi:hypothetical protein LCL95_04525 [Bacillus timonensis]|nr:hypothetical protein [Bacillus timonensis]
MGKKVCWIIIFICLAANVINLQLTVESYFGLEYDTVFRNTIVGIILSIITFIAYLFWKNIEYRRSESKS